MIFGKVYVEKVSSYLSRWLQGPALTKSQVRAPRHKEWGCVEVPGRLGRRVCAGRAVTRNCLGTNYRVPQRPGQNKPAGETPLEEPPATGTQAEFKGVRTTPKDKPGGCGKPGI